MEEPTVSVNTMNVYDLDRHMADWYDRVESGTSDVEQIRRLIDCRGPWRILEPFCGTGRILVPLAMNGHELAGIDQCRAFLGRCREKMAWLAPEIRGGIRLVQADVTLGGWPTGFDLVILGGNCFYELATADEQEGCIASAAESLEPGGYLYLDNDHMEGELDPRWCEPGIHIESPVVCPDGTVIQRSSEMIWFDGPARLWRARRSCRITFPDGTVKETERIQQKHPPSAEEMRGWLLKHGFTIVHNFGAPAQPRSSRATFWARKDA